MFLATLRLSDVAMMADLGIHFWFNFASTWLQFGLNLASACVNFASTWLHLGFDLASTWRQDDPKTAPRHLRRHPTRNDFMMKAKNIKNTNVFQRFFAIQQVSDVPKMSQNAFNLAPTRLQLGLNLASSWLQRGPNLVSIWLQFGLKMAPRLPQDTPQDTPQNWFLSSVWGSKKRRKS